MNKEELPKLITVKEAAEYLSVTPQTVRNLAKDNLIDYILVGNEYRIVRDTLFDSLQKAYLSSEKS